MQIQRWQSLFLFIAAALMGALNFMPLAHDAQGVAVTATQWPVLLIVNVLTAVLLFICIFLYKNLRKQMLVANVSIVLILLTAALAGKFIVDSTLQPAWCTVAATTVVSLVLAICARRLMSRDFNLLRSADRLR